jgi:hypothetical protein
MLDCQGQTVTNQLNQVFRNPGTPKYNNAQALNPFGAIQNVAGNWKDLLIAYLKVGVDVGNEFPAWVAYLETLGNDPNNIYKIAQTRFAALNTNSGVDTKTHAGGHTVGVTATSIDSPCPP